MASALIPIDVLCRLLITLHFPLSSLLRITVIWSPLFDYMTCMLRQMRANVAIGLKLGDYDEMNGKLFGDD